MTNYIVIIVVFIIFVVSLLFFPKISVITKSIEMKNYKGYQQYGMAAKDFFDKVKASFEDYFRYPFDRECPNYYFARIYEDDSRYRLVIDLGNLSAVAVINEFQFPPKSGEIQFADTRTNRTLNWVVSKKFYVYRDGSWELVSELERGDMLDMLAEQGMESEIDLEHAYALSYPNAKTASKTEQALCGIAMREFALETAGKAGVALKFKEDQGE